MGILAIMAEVGKPLSVNDFTDLLRKTGYAQVKVEIDARKPFKLGVLIQGKKGAFWQQFVYESLLIVCYQCGRLGHADESYRFLEEDLFFDSGDCSLLHENFVAAAGKASLEALVSMMAKGKGGDGGGWPRLGPWMVSSCIYSTTMGTQSFYEGEEGLGEGTLPNVIRSLLVFSTPNLIEGQYIFPELTAGLEWLAETI